MTEERLALSELLEKAGDGDFLLDRPSTRPRCLGAWVMVASFGDRIRPKLGAASATGAGRRRPTTSPICSPGCAADFGQGLHWEWQLLGLLDAPVELLPSEEDPDLFGRARCRSPSRHSFSRRD